MQFKWILVSYGEQVCDVELNGMDNTATLSEM